MIFTNYYRLPWEWEGEDVSAYLAYGMQIMMGYQKVRDNMDAKIEEQKKNRPPQR